MLVSTSSTFTFTPKLTLTLFYSLSLFQITFFALATSRANFCLPRASAEGLTSWEASTSLDGGRLWRKLPTHDV